jgi:hypothetical protein
MYHGVNYFEIYIMVLVMKSEPVAVLHVSAALPGTYLQTAVMNEVLILWGVLVCRRIVDVMLDMSSNLGRVC